MSTDNILPSAGTNADNEMQPIDNPSASIAANDLLAAVLSFYKQPFRKGKYHSWVYDANSNFVFQFESEFDETGEYAKGCKELQEAVICSINSKEQNPIAELKLSICKNDINLILNNDKPFITIRGWGNLTGVGAHNFSGEKAAKIQDEFRDWLISKLSINGG
jgi:hypothetical protein